jgi:hypothetical protein
MVLVLRRGGEGEEAAEVAVMAVQIQYFALQAKGWGGVSKNALTGFRVRVKEKIAWGFRTLRKSLPFLSSRSG